MLNTKIFDIQKFSVHDGPGVRTTVFLKGCPLRCRWCHNPESQNFAAEILFNPEKCTRCGRCAAVCPQHAQRVTPAKHEFLRGQCAACGACAKVCPTAALELCGQTREIAEVLAEVEKDRAFYENSGGGLTVSGGEPMANFEFTRELLDASRRAGIGTAMETCGFAPTARYQEILPLVDWFLFDIKTLDPTKHREFTGQDNALILENLRFLDARGAAIRLRCPLIPGLNDSDAELDAIAALANTLTHVQGIDLEPYHHLGVSKALQLGMQDAFVGALPDAAQKQRWRERVAAGTKIPVNLA